MRKIFVLIAFLAAIIALCMNVASADKKDSKKAQKELLELDFKYFPLEKELEVVTSDNRPWYKPGFYLSDYVEDIQKDTQEYPKFFQPLWEGVHKEVLVIQIDPEQPHVLKLTLLHQTQDWIKLGHKVLGHLKSQTKKTSTVFKDRYWGVCSRDGTVVHCEAVN